MTTKPQNEESLDHSGAHGAEPSGSTVVFTDITEAPLEPLYAAAKAEVMTDAMGALVIFDGIVRNHDHGSAVRGLSYSAHPQAREYIAEVAPRSLLSWTVCACGLCTAWARSLSESRL